jgi:hypothetical protein
MDSLVEVADRALYLSKRRAGTPSILQLAMQGHRIGNAAIV